MSATIKLGTLYVELTARAESFKKGVGEAQQKLKAFSDEAKRSGSEAQKSFKNMQTAFKQVATGAGVMGAAATAGFLLVTKAAADLEQSVMQAAAVTKGGVANFERFKAAAIAASQGSAFSAKEAGDALRYLSMAGLSTEQATKALPTTLSLATAGMIDLGRAADISSDIMTAFKLSAEDLAHVNDVLVGTTTQSNTNLEMLADSMKYVAPTAAAMGQSIETVSAAIGMLGNAGIKGSQAGTTLRMSMLRLVKPPKMARDALANLGVQVTDSEGKMLDMVSIIAQLERAQQQYGTNTTAFAADLAALFGVEAVSGIQAMVSQGAEAFARFRDDLTNTKDTAKRVEEAMLTTFSSQANILKGNLENLAAAIGDELIPYLKALNALFTQGAVDAQQQASSTATLRDTVAGLATGMGKLVKGMGYVAKVAGVFYVMLDALIGAGKMLTYIAAGLTYGVTAFGYALAGNVEEAVAFEARSVNAFKAIGQELDTMRTDWSNFYDVADKMTTVGEEVSAALDKVAQSGKEVGKELSQQREEIKLTTDQYKDMLEAYNVYQGGILGAENARISAYLENERKKTAKPEFGPIDRTQGAGGKGRGPQGPRGGGAKSEAQREREEIAKRNAEARKAIDLFEATRDARAKLARASDDYAKAEYQRQIRMEEIARQALTDDERRLAYLQTTDDYLNAIAQANAKAAEQAKERARAEWDAAQALDAQVKEAKAAKALADFQASAARGESQMQAAAGVGIDLKNQLAKGAGMPDFLADLGSQFESDIMSGLDPITAAFKAGGAWAQGIISWFMEQERMQQHLKVISQIAKEGFGIPDIMDEFLKAWEPAIGAIQLVIQALQPIRDLIPDLGIGQKLTQIFFNGIREFLQVVLKLAEGVAWVSKGIAYVGLKIVEIVDWIFGGINKVLAKIGLSINLDSLDKLKETMQTNYDMIGTSLDAVRDAQDALANATVESAQQIYNETKARAELEEKLREGIRNAPSGFKVERYRYGAQDPASSNMLAAMGVANRGGMTVMGDMVIVAHDYADFKQQMETESFNESGAKKKQYRTPKRARG